MPVASITVQGKAYTKKVVTAVDRDGKTEMWCEGIVLG